MNSASLYSELTGKIARVRRKEHGIALQTGVINSLTLFAGVWIAAISIELIFELHPEGRTALYWMAVGLSAVGALWLLAWPVGRTLGLLRVEDDEMLARRIGHGIPDIGDRLINTLQLYRASNSAPGYSPELMEASITVEGEPLRHYDYTVIVEEQDRRRALLLFLSAFLTIAAPFLAFPMEYRGALYRLTHYTQEFLKPAPFDLSIAPGDRRIVRGDSLEIIVRATGIPPRTVMLELAPDGEQPQSVELRADSLGEFRYMLPGVRTRTRYRAFSGPVRTASHTISVYDRPEITLFQATVAHPGYTGRKTERLPDNTGDVSGLRGTGVSIRVTTNVEPAKAFIVQLFPRSVTVASVSTVAMPRLYDTVRIPLRIDGTELTGGFRLSRDGEYYISVVTAEGLSNTSPVHYGMSVSSDGPPSIALLEPSTKVDIDERMLLPTQVQIADDYGFSRLRLYYRLTASRYEEPWKTFRSIAVPLPRGGVTTADVPYIWNLAGLNMVPEDELEIYFEVADNDGVAGPKVARTGTVGVRFPSVEEVLQQAEQTQQQANAELDKMLKDAREARQDMENLNRELMKEMAQNQQNAGWQQQQKMQEMIQRHNQMQQRLEKTAEDLRTMAERLKQAEAISPETLQKYEQLQQLFQEMKNPELQRSMEELQKAMEKMTPEQMAEAMKNYKFNEEQFRKSIERTMNILKRMQTEQKVDEMIRRAEELAKRQEELNKQAEQTPPNDKATREQMAERQKDLAKDAEQLKKETGELTKQMSEQGEDMPNKEMQEAQQSLQQDDPGEKMEQAGEKMEQGDMQEAQKQGEQAKKSAENFKQKMQGVKQKMKQNSQKEVANRMKKSLNDLLEISKREEDLKQRTEDAQPNSQQFRDLAQEQQQALQDMKNLTDQMSDLSQKSFAVTPEMGRELGDAMQKMQQATGSLEQRDGNKASQQEGGAMGAMNRAAMMMQQSLAQMQNGQGQGMGQGMASFQQRLQEMAAQQQMINMAMGQQQGEGQGEQEGKDGKKGKKGENGENGEGDGQGQGQPSQEQLRRLQQQQGQVKKSLDELNKEVRESGGTRKNLAGDLERAAREVEEVLRDMQSGRVTPETMQRQDKILSRMLDALKSQRERDFDKERESRPGTDIVRKGPGALDLGTSTDEDQIRRDALRTQDGAYSKDYEYLIRRYFESLGSNPRPSGAQ